MWVSKEAVLLHFDSVKTNLKIVNLFQERIWLYCETLVENKQTYGYSLKYTLFNLGDTSDNISSNLVLLR